MPYASLAQMGLFHSPNSPVSKEEVAKWDAESKGQKNLPQHSAKNKMPGHVKDAIRKATTEDKHEYVARTGEAPLGKKFQDWLEKKVNGDHSDSGYMKAFPQYGDQTLHPLKKGERSIPEREYMKEFGEDPRDDDYPTKGLGEMGHLSPKKFREGIKPMKPLPSKGKSVQVGVGPKEKAAAIARVKANQEAEKRRRARKEPDIESF